MFSIFKRKKEEDTISKLPLENEQRELPLTEEENYLFKMLEEKYNFKLEYTYDLYLCSCSLKIFVNDKKVKSIFRNRRHSDNCRYLLNFYIDYDKEQKNIKLNKKFTKLNKKYKKEITITNTPKNTFNLNVFDKEKGIFLVNSEFNSFEDARDSYLKIINFKKETNE